MREGGYELNEQVSDHPSYHTTADAPVPNEAPTWPGPDAPGLENYIAVSKRVYTPVRYMPHAHIPGYNSSIEGMCDHLALSHGFAWSTVGIMAARGELTAKHTAEHPDGIEIGP